MDLLIALTFHDMAHYGGYPEAEGGQVPPENPAEYSAAPAHGRRRMYPQQQYDFNAPAAPSYSTPVNAAPVGAPGYGTEVPGNAGGVFTPAAGPMGGYGHVDPLSAQFNNMNLEQAAAPVAAAASAVPAAISSFFQQKPSPYDSNIGGSVGQVPLNQLYNIDLFTLPPPITDLNLPPPPIVLPPGVTASSSPEANANSDYFRSTLNVVPTSSSLLRKSNLPFAVSIQPYISLLDSSAPIPVTEDTNISRCRRCRSYINPFVTFNDQSRKWICNICGMVNDIPHNLEWDPLKNAQVDKLSRTEIKYGVVEFLAGSEYMARPPQAPVYVFVLDVSAHAIQTGLLATAGKSILDSLDKIPNSDDRAKVGFIGVDSSLHFFKITGEQDFEPTELVVSDLADPFLPLPSGLLVNLTECRANIESFISNLGDMFAHNTTMDNALGSALLAAHKLASSEGGKIICITASLPNIGHAKLERREDRNALGTKKETALLQPGSSFYTEFANRCNENHITVDMFLFAQQYQDVATLSALPRYTAGQTYFYPGWTASRTEDVEKFSHEIRQHLSMEISMEAAMRMRASNEIQVSNVTGNFSRRSTELCSFPTFPRDQSYVFELYINETIKRPTVSFQCATLLTTCHGERRVRVITCTLPTSSNLQDIYASADQLAITHYLAQKATARALYSGLEDARSMIQNTLYSIVSTYKKELMTTNLGGSNPLQLCANLRMLPLLLNAMVKHVGLRKSTQIPTDMRSAALCLLSTLPVKYLIKYIYADFFSLYDMPEEAGLPDAETGAIVLPPKINLTGERLVPHGLYLINDGQTIFIWIGRDVVPQLCLDAFGCESLGSAPVGKAEFPEPESPSALNERIRNVIRALRGDKKDATTWQNIYFVREDGDAAMRLWASTFLVEDRTENIPSYYQSLTNLRQKVNE